MIMISPLPGATADEAGIGDAAAAGRHRGGGDANGESVPPGRVDIWSSKQPWPAMLRTIYGDPERYQ